MLIVRSRHCSCRPYCYRHRDNYFRQLMLRAHACSPICITCVYMHTLLYIFNACARISPTHIHSFRARLLDDILCSSRPDKFILLDPSVCCSRPRPCPPSGRFYLSLSPFSFSLCLCPSPSPRPSLSSSSSSVRSSIKHL